MARLIIVLSLLLSLPTYASDNTEINVQQEKSAEDDCMQRILNPCIAKCESQEDSDCVQACQENAKGECRQAGE
ncbi:hypothetical protein [Legionella jordanis]|uniref:Uncharacterized protein n=1 Tax=Legionella jordanis TaxID=456 RepID=A0A0W0V9A0_9GAMM|nr:hypothetical protein [Legionella jordanis]KTD16445.1 hypothetical protein Ljor_0751 [Legionella jordanis]RMX04003.1 hypothetical protein EAW55_06535 [Legionella jordanis]RMX15292.1 hypothetical protein EAS68_12840 [Legionella jordanis]VEH12095.1 Uncharacterised protein [Legionella jordanis]HAT8712604.1 hypothetical protein [Legionella jordanis]